MTLDDGATVEALRKAVATETALASYQIRYGYPPKVLPLEQWAPSARLSDIGVKLHGEQLIVSKPDAASSREGQPTATAQSTRLHLSNTQPTLSSAPTPPAPTAPTSQAIPRGHAQAPARPAAPAPSSPTSTHKPQNVSTHPGSQNVATQPPHAAPLSLSRQKNLEMDDPPEIPVPALGGTVVLRIMPDDNSCLFRAVASAAFSDMDTMTELRAIVAHTIQANPDTYSKAILDNKEPDDYCRWIQTEDAWGGQIELDILSRQCDMEICSIDVQTLRVDRYNESAPRRCFVVYSGIHYDTIALQPFGATPDEDIKQFSESLKAVMLHHAVELCKKLQAKHYYTDTANFKIKCNDCGAICTGEAGATAHAKLSGHYNFGEAR